MIRIGFISIILIRLTLLAAIAYVTYHLVGDPAAFGEGIGRFFGGIASGFKSVA